MHDVFERAADLAGRRDGQRDATDRHVIRQIGIADHARSVIRPRELVRQRIDNKRGGSLNGLLAIRKREEQRIRAGGGDSGDGAVLECPTSRHPRDFCELPAVDRSRAKVGKLERRLDAALEHIRIGRGGFEALDSLADRRRHVAPDNRQTNCV